FPIAAFYFHQASGLFLLGNVFMVPASFVMILGGMITVTLASFNIEIPLWVSVFNWFFWFCNNYIEWLSSFKNMVVETISFNPIQVFILLLMVVGIRFLVLKFSPRNLIYFMMLISIFEFIRIDKNYKFNQKEELIVFNQYKNSILGIRNGRNLDVLISNRDDSIKINQYLIKPYSINEGIHSVNYFDMESELNLNYIKTKNILIWNGKRFLIANR